MGQHLGEGLHGEGPLGDQLLPAGQRGEDAEEVVPQLPADVNVKVPLDPGHDQRLDVTRGRGFIITKVLFKVIVYVSAAAGSSGSATS